MASVLNHGRRWQKSSRSTDFRTAERIARELEADVALRREGVVDARHERFTEEKKSPPIHDGRIL